VGQASRLRLLAVNIVNCKADSYEVVLSTTCVAIKNLAYAYEVVLSTTFVAIKNLAYAYEVVLSTTFVAIKNF
jgi:hypothetical protein